MRVGNGAAHRPRLVAWRPAVGLSDRPVSVSKSAPCLSQSQARGPVFSPSPPPCQSVAVIAERPNSPAPACVGTLRKLLPVVALSVSRSIGVWLPKLVSWMPRTRLLPPPTWPLWTWILLNRGALSLNWTAWGLTPAMLRVRTLMMHLPTLGESRSRRWRTSRLEGCRRNRGLASTQTVSPPSSGKGRHCLRRCSRRTVRLGSTTLRPSQTARSGTLRAGSSAAV